MAQLATLGSSPHRSTPLTVGGARRQWSDRIAAEPSLPAASLYRQISSTNGNTGALKACLTEIVARLEPGITAAQLQDCLPESTLFDELGFSNAMANLGYRAQCLKVAPADIDPRLLPCLFISSRPTSEGLGSPTVLLPENDNEHGNYAVVGLYQNEAGAFARMMPDELEALGPGQAYIFKRHVDTDEPTSRVSREQSGYSWLQAVVARFKGLMWQLLAIGFLLNIVALSSPLFLMVVYDRVISSHNTVNLPMLATGIGLAVISEFALRSLRTRVLSWLTARINYIVGTQVFSRLIELPPNVARKVTVTAQLARMRSFESVRDFFSGPIFVSAMELPSVVIAIFVLAFFSPVLAAVPVVLSLVYGGLFFVLRSKVSQAIKVAATNASLSQRFSIEMFQELEDIRITGLSDVWKEKYREISGRDGISQARLQFLGTMGENLSYAISILASLSVLVIGVDLVWSNDITVGMLVASMILIWRALSPFYAICSMVPRFEQFRNSVAQLNGLMDLENESEQRKARARLPSINGQVQFEHVTVRHSREAGPLFVGLSTKIEPGEIVAITGAAGTGKSTIIKLIQATAQPQLGKVSIDGFNVYQLLAHDLRRQISYVPQDVAVYPGTVAEILRTAKADATNEELWAALELAGVATQVRALPAGLDQIFNGEVQKRIHVETLYRLMFARVYLQNSNLVLIDQIPSTILNTGVDQVLVDVIARCRRKKTVVFITQRSDHMRLADKVIGLRYGKTPIVGNLDTLLGEKQ